MAGIGANTNKLEQVMEWLNDVFHDEPIPRFDQNTEFVDQLYDVMVASRSLDQSSLVHQQVIQRLAQQYTDDAQCCSQILTTLGLQSYADGSCSSEADHLTKLASSLELANTEDSSFILALTRLSLEQEKTTAEVAFLEQTVSKKEKDLAQCLQDSKRFENLCSSIQTDVATMNETMAAQAKKVDFLSQKRVKYDADLKRLDQTLSETGVESCITHSKLVTDHNELQKLQDRLKLTRDQLAMYSNLPPDIDLAKVKLALVKSELQDLEDKLCKQIDMYHL